MVYLFPRMPKGSQVISSEFKGETVYLAQGQYGPVVHFVATNEVKFMSWDEIIEYLATAPALPLPEDEPEEKRIPVKEEKKPGIREVRPSKPN